MPPIAGNVAGISRPNITVGKVVRVGTSVAERQPASLAKSTPDLRQALRFALSVCGSVALCLFVWHTRSRTLTGPINIVGSPTFSDFNYPQYFTAYRLATYVFAPVAILLFVLMSWRGPLRGPARGRRTGAIPLIVGCPVLPARTGVDRSRATRSLLRPAAIVPAALKSIPAAVFVALTVSTTSRSSRVGVTGIVCAVAYVVGVFAVAIGLRWGLSRRAAHRGPMTGCAFTDCLAAVNALGAVAAAAGGMYLISANSDMWSADGSARSWPWLPWWLAGSIVLIGWAWFGWQIHLGRSPVGLEARLRQVLLGSATIYLLRASFPGPIGSFQGFDDAQSLVGADLLGRGYFPWRDFQFIHGLFLDALRSTFGFRVFGPTQWGSTAGMSLVISPLTWVGVYLLVVWAAPRRSLLVLAPLGLAAWGGSSLDPRFIAVPIVFVLLGKAIGSPRPAWTIAFTAALFVDAVLVPETAYQVLAAGIVLIAADVVHRRSGDRWQVTMRRTGCFLAVGVILSAGWAGFLAGHHALTAFLQYFVIFGPGHDAAGAHPVASGPPPGGISAFSRTMFVIMVVLVAITTWTCVWRLRERHSWTPLAWVTVAAAITAGLYGEKALGRPDDSHVQQAITVGLPLIVLSLAGALPVIDSFIAQRVARLRPFRMGRARITQPAAVLMLIVTLVAVPSIITNSVNSPQRYHASIGAQLSGTRLGYAASTALAPDLLADLTAVLDTYAAGNSPIFDMTNSPGYYYFLLQRRPATQFVHVSMAIPEFAQSLLVKELAQTRPRLVVFDAESFGVPTWDGIRNSVRHFQVSQYLLDGWTPILATHGVLFLLRNDLVAARAPAPQLSIPAQTTNLYFSSGACNWGDAANFLNSPSNGSAVTTVTEPLPGARRVSVRGWALDRTAGRPASRVVFAVGAVAVASLPLDVQRQDVATDNHLPSTVQSGFDGALTMTGSGRLAAYALEADGALHLLPGVGQPSRPAVTTKLQMPDGSSLPVSGRPALGDLEVEKSVPVRLTKLTVPGSQQLSTFDLATFSAAGAIGSARLNLSDGLASTVGSNGHEIQANTLLISGSAMSVRVGSCPPWHGYASRTLYLTQYGGTPVTKITLSGVHD